MRIKTLLTTTTLAVILFTGCSDKNSANACSFDISMALDKSDYDYVISNINSCSGFNDAEKNMNLGAAYFGKAGYTVTSLVADLASGSSGNDSGSDKFLKSFAVKGSQDSFNNLTKSREFYEKISSKELCSSANVGIKTQIQKDACFNVGLVDIAKGASTIGLLFSNETDLNSWLNGGTANINATAKLNDGTLVSDAIATALNDGIDTVILSLQKKDNGEESDIAKDSQEVKDEIYKNSTCSLQTQITGNCINEYIQNTNSKK